MPKSSLQPPASSPRIILGVCGGIAAYKTCELASRLTQQGYDVHVVMTQSATRFVAPLTFQALTLNPVHTSLWPQDTASESGVAATMAHISLAESADAVLIAPATADFIAKLATGQADDLLSTLVLATRAPVLVAPAMNPLMLSHPATQENLLTFHSLGYKIIHPEVGRMACEHVGEGRLPTTEVLLDNLQAALTPREQDLKGRRIIITAGPTRENLDPVRFISNRSSGKMGYALAAEAAARGANVLLVSGPTNLRVPMGVDYIGVTSTQEMFSIVQRHMPLMDVFIAAAAPADYAVREINTQKIKKRAGNEVLHLELVPTTDIIATVAKDKKLWQICIGFAAETNSDIEEAKRKLYAKNLDAIVFNDVTQEGAGFDVDTNRVTWISPDQVEAWPLLTKHEVAAKILGHVVDKLEAYNASLEAGLG